ncbi:Protein kinase-like domain containing protein [Gigaspora margarita]|uniref:Protein kinase-like domain containing protein n=1 Tax=Gigaspora margarita TaxID=4874 RepID=A0A8H4APR2_GIGMA|nr:Protein kinase-like domain containing protein [Gigaspora margarita]
MFDNISLPSVEEVQKWTRTDVINFLQENADEDKLDLDDDDIAKIKKNKDKGSAFLELTREELLAFPYELPGGPAKVIVKLIKTIKGEGQATTAPNQEVQELKERLAILQASKIREEVPIYFQYLESGVIKTSANGWEDFIELYDRLEKAFGLKGSLSNYKLVISNKNIDFSWSKKDFVDFIEKHKCSAKNPVRILGVKKGVKRSYIEMIGDLPPPSTLGAPKEWFKLQKCNPIDHPICLNHRPPEASSTIPVSLYSPIFGKFKDFCEEDPEREDNQFTYKFCYEMAKYYEREEDRQDEANKMLEKYLGPSVELLTVKRKSSDGSLKDARTDGTMSFSKYRGANFEYKCDDCSSGTSPYLENCSYYFVFCNEQANRPSFDETNLPCFLVTIAGPYFSVSGAVLAEYAIVDPLTPVFPLIWQKHDEMTLSLSRTFRALKKSLKILDHYYKQVDEQARKMPQTINLEHPLFPEVTIDDKCYSVQIIRQIGNYLLWEVTLSNEQGPTKKAYVKAIQKRKYSLNTHQLLAEAGHAPKVLATSVIPGNWLLVYMEYLDNHSTLNRVALNLNDQDRNSLRVKIETIVEHLHNLGHVHGDLREGNILIRQFENNDFDVKLIDFEWSGKVGSAHYSHFMNHVDIKWPDGAEDGKLVTKTHDLTMLNQTLLRTGLSQNQMEY